MQNQSKDSFPSDTRKNLRDYMALTLRSGRELEERRKEKKDTVEEQYADIGEHFKQHSPKLQKKRKHKDVAKEKCGKRKSREKGRG